MSIKRRFLIKIAAICLIICVACLCFAACDTKGGDNKDVTKIQLVTGTFSETYSLDQAVDLSVIKVVATYSNGGTRTVVLDESALSGFDLSTTGSKTLTVKYGGAETTFDYRVTNSYEVTTPLRLKAAYVVDGGVLSVSLTLENAEKMPAFALKYEATTTLAYYGHDLSLDKDIWRSAASVSDGKRSFVYYTKDGSVAIDKNTEVAKLTFAAASGTINFSNVYMTDGTADRRIPNLTLTVNV